jgi:hypothetical protein
MWKKVRIYGNDFHLFIRNGQITKINSGGETTAASQYQSWFPNLFKALSEAVKKGNSNEVLPLSR